MAKYKTLKELKGALDSGEISKESILFIDNDSTYLYDDNTYDKEEEDFTEKAVFGMHPTDLLDEALTLLGIKCSGV